MKIMIGIPAYNEEKNIGNLLNDIISQKLECNVEDIFVISDCSTDNTNDIVSRINKEHTNVKLIIREKRMGKSSALNLMFHLAKGYDVLVLLDADIRLDFGSLRLIIEKTSTYQDIDLIAGNPIPFLSKDILNIAEQASFFSWILLDKIKNVCSPNLYHAHGRILILTKRIYDTIKIPENVTIGNDQYIYLYCAERELKFEYLPDVKVFYKLPKTIGDYLKQNIRFSVAIKEKEEIFGKFFISKHVNVNNKISIFLECFLRYPYKGLCWVILYMIGKISVMIRPNNQWEISRTTK